MAAELYRAAQAITEAEARGDAAAVSELARRTLARWAPELERVKKLPARGWMRTPERCWDRKSNWGELPWFRARCAGK